MQKFKRSGFVVGAIAAFVASSTTVLAQPALSLSPVVRNTDPVPGFAGEMWTQSSSAFQNPTIDLSNNVAFFGDIADSGVISSANDGGYWYGAAGTLGNVVQEGGPVLPGTTAETFVTRQTTTVAMSPNGNMWLAGSVSGAAITVDNDQAIWVGQNGGFQKFYQEGDAVPSIAGAVRNPASSSSSSNYVNNAGQSVLNGTILGGPAAPANSAVWVGSAGSLGLVYQNGVANAAFPGGEVIQNGGARGLNGSGTLQLFNNLTVGVGGATTADSAVVMNGDGTGALSLIGRSNQPTGIAGINYGETIVINPFFPPQTPFFNTRQTINNSGRNIFGARIAGAGITQGVNDSALMTHNGGTTEIVHQTGGAAPNIPSADLSSINFNEASVNNNDQIAWVASLAQAGDVTSANDSGLWLTQIGGGDQLIVREGDAVPGLTDTYFGSASNVLLNNMGQLIFTSVLNGGSVSSSNDRSIWSWDPTFGLQLVVREGISYSGVYASSFSYDASANGEGGSQAFNDLGCLTLKLNASGAFGTNAGIFVTCIPEPTTGLLLLSACGLAITRRRR